LKQVLALIVSGDVAEDQSFGRNNLAKLAFHRVVVAVRPAHDDAQLAAWTCIKFADRIGESTGSEPLCIHFRVGPGFPHKCARRIENANKGDARFSVARCFFGGCHYQRPV
jgi:hypothetical protein